jgi:uncharacterized protein (DUF1501 family)
MNKRAFLKIPLALSASYILPHTVLSARQSKPKYLILIELNGGNDGLNTIVPFRDPMYKKLRRSIGLGEGEVIPLTDHLAMHKSLEPLHDLWVSKQFAIINGVGYEDPNRSHFRSIEIWDTASHSDQYLSDGWLSRVIPGEVQHEQYLVDGIVIGRNALPLSGNSMRTIVMNTIADFTDQARLIEERRKQTENPALSHILEVQSDIKYAAQAMEKKLRTSNMKVDNFKAGPFGKQLQEAAKLILNGTAAPVIKVSIGSFDTHAGQKGTHQRLLKQLADGVSSFSQVLRENQLWGDVLMMTYSEFGRRAMQNANNGTDHGTSAPHFMFGGNVKGGMYGEQPSLNDLLDDDLRYKVDYRSLYNTVAKNWWSSSKTINIDRYPALNIITKI